MNTNVQPAKKIAAEIDGEVAILSDVLEARLQIKGMGRKERDNLIANLGILALERALDQCIEDTSNRFPDADALRAWLTNRE